MGKVVYDMPDPDRGKIDKAFNKKHGLPINRPRGPETYKEHMEGTLHATGPKVFGVPVKDVIKGYQDALNAGQRKKKVEKKGQYYPGLFPTINKSERKQLLETEKKPKKPAPFWHKYYGKGRRK